MLKHLSTYQDYIDFLVKMEEEYRDLFKLTVSSPNYSKALFKMVFLDVDALIPILEKLYSNTGRPATNQIEMFRSIILMSHFRCLSFKKWANRLKEEPLLALLSGFKPGDTPSFSGFYDFAYRLYKDKPDRILKEGYFKNDYKKPEGKHEKLENFKPETVYDLYEKYSSADYRPEKLKEDTLLDIYNALAVKFSKSKGLIDDEMVLSGDGTSIWTHSNHYGHKVEEDKDLRRYSDVDADIGYDSDLEKFYFGYTGYNLSIYNQKYKIDLPVFLTLAKASRHDAITSIKSLATFNRLNESFRVSHICFDSASDNYATFQYSYYLKMIPIIDLNKRSSGKNIYAQYNDISENGKPVCQFGKEAVPYGRDMKRQRHKYRCPYYSNLSKCDCPFKETCTKSKYGRVFYIKFKKDIKLFGAVPYGTEEWKSIYSNRTSTERINTRLLNDYSLKDLRMHGRKLYFLMMISMGINIHLDAYHKVSALMN